MANFTSIECRKYRDNLLVICRSTGIFLHCMPDFFCMPIGKNNRYIILYKELLMNDEPLIQMSMNGVRVKSPLNFSQEKELKSL